MEKQPAQSGSRAQFRQDPQISVAVVMPQVVHGYLQQILLSNVRYLLQEGQNTKHQKQVLGLSSKGDWSPPVKYFSF